MMTLISRWFVQTTPSQDYRSSDYVVLWLILGVGVFLRFWGLGNVGLHGDEETMAMPAMAILETGQPYLPSGMYYARALLEIYMMSGSVLLFGESEWAFRLPSAIVGSFTALAAFFMGRRFLAPHFNLAFVATIAFLPSMIEISQTARMYVFFVTGMIWFGACLFRWERDQRISSLFLALLVWVFSLHFHSLAIFAAPLFLFPGLSRQSWKQLIQGAIAFAVGGVLFKLYSGWISAKYPDESKRLPPLAETVPPTSLEVLIADYAWLVIGSAVVIAALVIALLFRVAKGVGPKHAVPIVLIGLGLLAMSVLQYHAGGILLLFGLVFWLRTPDLPKGWLLGALLLAAAMTVIHLALLYTTGLYPGRSLIGALVGIPSAWPTLRFLVYSPFAGALYVVVLLVAFTRFSKLQPLPIHFLFFVMAVWAPVVILGFFTSHMPPRYAQGQLGYFLLCTWAGCAYLARDLKWPSDRARMSFPRFAMLVLIAAAIVNPFLLWRTANPGYDMHPDHKGAARFIQSLELDPEAILIAEDVLQQTYYLGEVDYSLRPVDDARVFSYVQDGQLIDQYTGAPVLGTGEELETVLNASDNREVYIIGSGENFRNGVRGLRGYGIAEVLQSDRLRVVYEGQDGKTKVWKLRQ